MESCRHILQQSKRNTRRVTPALLSPAPRSGHLAFDEATVKTSHTNYTANNDHPTSTIDCGRFLAVHDTPTRPTLSPPNYTQYSDLHDDFLAAVNPIHVDLGPVMDFPDIRSDPLPIDQDLEGPRAQIDTGAFVSCTDQKNLLHNYQEFGPEYPCPIRLMPATVDSDAVPKGYGYLHVPARNTDGFLPVRTFYTPELRTTVIDERDLVRAAGHSPQDIRGEKIIKFYDSASFTYCASHKQKSSLDVVIHGVLRNGKCYTGVLFPPCSKQRITELIDGDAEFAADVQRATLFHIYAHQENEYRTLRHQLETLPVMFHDIPFHQHIQHATPIQAIRQETERLLWHQRLGHPSDYYLFHAHKHIKGVPKFKHLDPILDRCPTCIRAKQTKEPAGPNTTRVATVPYQGLSIDLSFAGTKSKDSTRAKDFVGLNGETCWILITDHFSRMKHGETRISKASPLAWLRKFLAQYTPACTDKYAVMDQGGELYGNPQVRDLLQEFGYDLRPTGADASNQNGSVERGHLTVANAVRALLVGANLPIKFWPYAFHHWLRIDNSLPSRDQTESPLKIALNQTDDFSNFRTFGCRVWVRPPGRRHAKFRPNSRKGIFLGFLPRTTTNILWYDPETSRVKIAKHARFDEGMNDLPPDGIPPNVVHLQRTQLGEPLPEEGNDVSVPMFEFGTSPFSYTFVSTVPVSCRHHSFGLTIGADELNNRAYVADIKQRSSASRIFSTHKATTNRIRGAYVIKINEDSVFTKEEVLAALAVIRQKNIDSFKIEFAPEPKISAKDVRDAVKELNLHAPHAVQDDTHVPTLSIADVRAIAALRFPSDNFSVENLPTEQARLAVAAIRSGATTTNEQSIGNFTRRKLKTLDTWPLWETGERKQLDQFHNLGMYGAPTDAPPGAIVLRQHWQYHIKRDGTRRARNCCDGSPRAAPVLHRFAQTYSSCVEQPIQRLFFAVAAEVGYQVFGGDAKDAYAHSPPPERPTFVRIDDAYADWYRWRFGTDVDRSKVLPVLHALQGHPESGRLWEEHISAILCSKPFNFRPTTHDRNIYRGDFEGQPIFLLRQVDDFALAAPSSQVAQKIYATMGTVLQLPSEDQPPFAYLGLIKDFNGVDVQQYSDRTVLSCANYIDRVLRTHGWETPAARDDKDPNKPQSPIPMDALNNMYSSTGHAETTPAHQALVRKFGFSYRTLLGELLYAYITCRPDIGYSVVTLSKFAASPSELHFSLLKKVAKYLRRTKHWGIHFHRKTPDSTLPQCPFDSLAADISLPSFPPLEHGMHLTCFLDAAHANDLRKRRSTTGFAFLLAGGCISYKCKTQAITATSSTEAEFYAAISAAKHARYLRAILIELGFPQNRPTPLYCDNESAIKMVNARIPTDRSRHILIQYFAIQDWKQTGDIILRHIPGIINPSDDLTKPLGWILHSRHSRRLMGHYMLNIITQ